jgi:hypothetical protein
MRSQMRTIAFTSLLAGLMLAFLVGFRGDTARAQHKRAANDNASDSSQKSGQTKHVFVGSGSNTAQGSRVTIKSDNPLNDYSAYRSGDRFYVVLPRAAAGGVARGGAGHGYSDMQVQQRGDSVVLSYRVQPGAKPRVEQKFNRLDVVFDAPEGGQSSGTSNTAQTSEAQNGDNGRTNSASENRNPNTSGRNAAQTSPTPVERRNATEDESAGRQVAGQQNAGSPNATTPSLAATAPSPGVGQGAQNPAPAQTPEATPAGDQSQVAQNQPQPQIAPITTTNPAPGAATSVSFGTYVLNNWPYALFVALFVVGLGLIFAARRSSSAQPGSLEDSKISTTETLDSPRAARLKDAPVASKVSTPEVSRTKDTLPLVAASALAVAPAVVEPKKESKRKAAKKKSKEKARRAEEAKRAEVSRRIESAAAAEAAARAVVEESPVEERRVEEPLVEQAVAEERATEVTSVEPPFESEVEDVAPVEETSVVAVEEPEPEHTEQVEAAESEVLQAEVAAPSTEPTTEIAPAAAFDPERAQAEARSLVEGGEYDRAVVSTSDSMARQMVAAELLSALAGRNAERRARARAAFVEHGYFDETARDLREAEAPAERSAAARSLALVGSRDATPHLVAALEDTSVDVRRAAVEALGSLRDPEAVAPLESLLEREKQRKNGIPSRIIRSAVEFCREGAIVEETVTAVEATVPASEPQEVSAGTANAKPPVEPAPGVEMAIEVAPVSDVTTGIAPSTEAIEDGSVSTAEEELRALAEELEVFGEAAAPDESALPPDVHHVAAESHAIEVSQSADFQLVEPPSPKGIEHVEEDALATEPQISEATVAEPHVIEETGLQHVEEAEQAAVEPYEQATDEVAESAVESVQSALFEESAADVSTREIEQAPSFVEEESSTEIEEAPASEWFEFDVHEKRFESKPTAVEPAAHVSDASSGETLSPAAQDVARAAEDARAVEANSTQVEHSSEPSVVEEERHVPAAESAEKGVAPFDEYSTVPASIQQRLSSLEASERAAAITELSHVDSDEAFQQICMAFDDDAKEVRGAAARALYDLRADRADSFTRALREATPERRRQIGEAISTSGLASEAVSQLTGESRERTYEAFSLLFLMAKAGEVHPLIRAIEGHPNNEVRLAVVKLLALSGQKEILPAFRRLAVRGSLPTEVRSAVMEAIYQISSSSQPVA